MRTLTIALIITFPFWWALLGGIILCLFDRDGRLFNWIEQAPKPHYKIVVLWLWPLVFVVQSYFKIRDYIKKES